MLGVGPDASREEIARAYRDLAKRFHPDRAPARDAARRMAEVNAAKDLLLGRVDGGMTASPSPAPPPAPAPRPPAGAWLAPEVRARLAKELLVALRPGEQVDLVLRTVTADSHEVQLACTDRRLLWLRDDAITGRVRTLAYDRIAAVTPVQPGRLRRRTGRLRVRALNGRRFVFSELSPRALDALVVTLGRRTTPAG